MIIKNRKAYFNYNLFEKIEAGIVLTGSEAKTLMTKGADLSQSFVKIINSEMYLINANIHTEGDASDSSKSRKLLLHRKEITSITTKIKARKLTLVPTKLYNRGHKIKVEVALAKSKKEYSKKEAAKKKDIEREIEREFKQSV